MILRSSFDRLKSSRCAISSEVSEDEPSKVLPANSGRNSVATHRNGGTSWPVSSLKIPINSKIVDRRWTPSTTSQMPFSFCATKMLGRGIPRRILSMSLDFWRSDHRKTRWNSGSTSSSSSLYRLASSPIDIGYESVAICRLRLSTFSWRVNSHLLFKSHGCRNLISKPAVAYCENQRASSRDGVW